MSRDLQKKNDVADQAKQNDVRAGGDAEQVNNSTVDQEMYGHSLNIKICGLFFLERVNELNCKKYALKTKLLDMFFYLVLLLSQYFISGVGKLIYSGPNLHTSGNVRPHKFPSINNRHIIF